MQMRNASYYVVYVTAPPAEAETLAQVMVEQQVAACVNIIPMVRSIYRWKGEICNDGEALLVIKTTAARLQQLETLVVEHHPYEVPEIIALPIAEGHAPYLRWIDESTGGNVDS
jgi:periplasmic divalent cation tolerance protein